MRFDAKHACLTAAQMQAADKVAIHQLGAELALMRYAVQAASAVILQQFAPCAALVLCGPGNNGGDGFGIAQKLLQAGWDVTVAASMTKGSKAAEQMRQDFTGNIIPLSDIHPLLLTCDIVIDALFGTGLERSLSGEYASVVQAINASSLPVVAIDIPSGIHSDTGEVLGAAIKAELTLAIASKKCGHLLMPGLEHSGSVIVCNIGITPEIIAAQNPSIYEVVPELWLPAYPRKQTHQHKYHHGHAVIVGGDVEHSGAALLAAEAALRIGAGLVTLCVPQSDILAYAARAPRAIMIRSLEKYFDALLMDERCNAWLIGPGGGANQAMRDRVKAIMAQQRATVLDADALTAFAGDAALSAMLHTDCVLTPHQGEFRSLFPDIVMTSKIQQAVIAARQCRATILLKGPDTVIADAEGTTLLHGCQTPQLATAGAGDVLAGMITGLLAQGMPTLEATAAAANLHAIAASYQPHGLIADDLLRILPDALSYVEEKYNS